MTFSDDDLKRLEEWLISPLNKDGKMTKFPHSSLVALLSRLEAAEGAIEESHYVPCAEIPCEQCDRIIVWRKAAGK